MGLQDKIKNKVQDVTGKGKEAVGDATDDQSMEREGKADQTKSSLKDAGENIKDAFNKK
jgi:uncharacterized protein YjbJ (UPF0337 family)